MDGKPRALIVDDVPDIAELLSLYLQRKGFQTSVASSAAKALNAARAEQFDVVISDIGMPEMNGYELAEALRKLPEHRDTIMIAITGYSMYEDRERALAAGFDAHLVKPISPTVLTDLLTRLSRQRRRGL